MDIRPTREVAFSAVLEWTGDGHGSGTVTLGSQVIELSASGSTDRHGVGPEGLLASAAGASYTAVLAGLLSSAGLPHRRLRIGSEVAVVRPPSSLPQLARIRVSPVILGGDQSRVEEYGNVARAARAACFVGRHLRPDVTYEVDEVIVEEGEEGDANLLDVRSIPPSRRHQLIFTRLDQLPKGGALTLINDHDPLPLRYQLEATRGNVYGWEYLEEGPQVWRVRISREV
jgi:uncharacterized protein (DUF2249 family)/organic hydroperoxide reductase OsmC/OhrA